MPQIKLRQSTRDQIDFDMPVTYPSGVPKADVTNLQALVNNLGTILLNDWDGPINTGDKPVTFDVNIDDRPQLRIGNEIIEITNARVTGAIRCNPVAVPIKDSSYLANELGEPFAAAALIDFKGALSGFTASILNNELRMFSIPSILRNVRPIRKAI
jgi:hypothetical protein